MELFHLKTPYLDCPQCFFYNSRAPVSYTHLTLPTKLEV